jgi:CRISPR-associated endoribonuclease Cas6
MRLKLLFQINKKEFPKDYRKHFISFIKYSLSETNQEFYHSVYDENTLKPFTFAIYFVKPKFQEDMIFVEEEIVTMNISFGNYEYGIQFYNGFVQQLQSKFEFGKDFSMVLKTIQLIPEKKIKSERIQINTLSPIIVRQHTREMNNSGKDRYLKYSDDGFEKHLKDSILRSIKENTESSISQADIKVEELIITPIKMKSIPISHFLDRIGTYLEGNIGELLIEGDQEVLDYLYRVGIGSRRAQGFGMIDVI